MDMVFILLVVIVILAIVNTERQAGSIRRSVARVDRKLNLILKQMNITCDEFAVLSEEVKELARDPYKKIAAIKLYREETGAGLVEAKETVEAFIHSSQR